MSDVGPIDSFSTSSEAPREAALGYAAAGHPIFPLWSVAENGSCHCGDPSCGKRAGKHPNGKLTPNGCLDATDDPAKVEAWWKAYPSANIGLATGHTVFIVDCDKHVMPDGSAIDGTARFLNLFAERGDETPQTATAHTGGGGAHFFFAADPDVEIRNQQEMLVDGRHTPGIDVRGSGGYVVVPPSIHLSQRRYSWVRGLEHLRAAPPWLLQMLAVPGSARRAHLATAGQPAPGRWVDPETLALLVAALDYVPPNTSRTEWVERVSMPLHDAFGGSEQGFAIWHAWCQRGQRLLTPNGNPAYGGEAECRRVWRSFSATHRNPKGLPTLFEFAVQHGWRHEANGADAEARIPRTPNGQPADTTGRIWQPPKRIIDPEELAAAMSGPRDPGPFPTSVVHSLEGPIAELVAWIQSCSRRPDPTIAFAAALGITAAALGRRVVGPGATRPTLAIACLAPSGAGKELAIACLKSVLASRPNLLVGLLDDSPTHRVQLDELLLKKQGQALLALDEYGATLHRWLSGRDPASASMSPTMRRLVTHSDSIFELAPVSSRHPARAANKDAWDAGIYAPAVSLVGFATPGQFYEALSESSLVDGFLGRHVVISSDSPADLRTPPDKPSSIPAIVAEWCASLERLPIPATDRAKAVLARMAPMPPTPLPVMDPVELAWESESAAASFAATVTSVDAAAHEAIRQGDEVATAVLRRLPGQIATLAFVLACGETTPVVAATVAERHIQAALRVAKWSADHLAWKLRHGAPGGPQTNQGTAYVRLCEAIERAGGKRVYRSVIGRKAWLVPSIVHAWKLVMEDPRFVTTEKWARLRTSTET